MDLQNTCSERHSLSSAVLQRSILDPLLFTIVINDIVEEIKKCKISLYADDTVVFTADKDSKIIEKTLSTELNNITNGLTSNNFILWLKKAEIEFVLCGTHQQRANLRK